MGISFVKNGANVLINDGVDVMSAPGSAFVRPHPTKPGAIVISEKANPQNEYDGITILVSSVTAPSFTDRNDLITKLSTDFFFRVSGLTEAAADLRYLQVSEGEPLDIGDLVKADLLHALQMLGSEIKALPIGVFQLLGSTYTLVDGRSIGQLFVIDKAVTITGAAFVQQTQGNYTADNYNGFALLSVNKTTGVATKVTETADDGNIWKAAALAKVSKAFPAPVTLQPGVYALMAVWNASATTQAPVVYAHVAIGTQYKKTSGGVLDISFYIDPKNSFGATENISAGLALSNVTGFWLY
jgi:hypothetical protein